MFGLFKSQPFSDPHLGELRRTRGLWRGSLLLGKVRVPLVVTGSRAAPDPKALDMARSTLSDYPEWRVLIERAVFEHYTPYAEAIAAGEAEPPETGLPRLVEPNDVWPYTFAEFVQVTP